MGDFLFGVLCGAAFMAPAFALGHWLATRQGWKREDALRQRFESALRQNFESLRHCRVS